MRKFLYLSLIDRLKQLTDKTGDPAIKTFDLWNEQVDFIEQEEVFDTPAAFIEFMPVKWGNLGGATQRAEVTIRLHIVTPLGRKRTRRQPLPAAEPRSLRPAGPHRPPSLQPDGQ